MVWEGYTDTLFAKPFEEACGVTVNATYMGSSDDLVAKLRAGGAETFDLISPSSDAATAILDAGLSQPLDLARIPSYATLSEGFRALPVVRKDSAVYGVPWAFGPNPLIYDTTKITTPPESWAVLWEPKYKGKLSLQDDIATLYMVAQYLGMDDPRNPAQALQPVRRGAGQGQGQDARAPPQRAEVLGDRGRPDPAVPERRGGDGRGLAAHDQPASPGRAIPRARPSRPRARPAGPTTGC